MIFSTFGPSSDCAWPRAPPWVCCVCSAVWACAVLLEELDPPCLSDWQPQRTDMVSATANAASSRVVLPKAIHLSPVGQRARGCVPPREQERSQHEGRRNGTHPPYVLYSLTLAT